MKPLFIKQSAHNSPSDLLGNITMKFIILLTAIIISGCQAFPEQKHDFFAAKPVPVGWDLTGVWVGMSPDYRTQANILIKNDGTGGYCLEYGSNSAVADLKIIRESGKTLMLLPKWEAEISNGNTARQKIVKPSLLMAKEFTINKGQKSDISPHCRKLFEDLQ